ncbi:MAG: zinc ribbon domain-containing protein [Promethearchaeota archaeon]
MGNHSLKSFLVFILLVFFLSATFGAGYFITSSKHYAGFNLLDVNEHHTVNLGDLTVGTHVHVTYSVFGLWNPIISFYVVDLSNYTRWLNDLSFTAIVQRATRYEERESLSLVIPYNDTYYAIFVNTDLNYMGSIDYEIQVSMPQGNVFLSIFFVVIIGAVPASVIVGYSADRHEARKPDVDEELITCSNCGEPNPLRRKHCKECGSRL